MKAVIVRWTEPRHDHAAACELAREMGIFQQSRQIEALSLYEDAFNFRSVLETEMSAIRWKVNRIFIGIGRPRLRLELAIEELIEALERGGAIDELLRL